VGTTAWLHSLGSWLRTHLDRAGIYRLSEPWPDEDPQPIALGVAEQEQVPLRGSHDNRSCTRPAHLLESLACWGLRRPNRSVWRGLIRTRFTRLQWTHHACRLMAVKDESGKPITRVDLLILIQFRVARKFRRSNVERLNLSLRTHLRRSCNERTQPFAWYNFVRVNSAIRCPLAMQAGWATTIWTMRNLLAMRI